MKYKQVTADELAEFLSSFRTYATESVDGDDYHSDRWVLHRKR